MEALPLVKSQNEEIPFLGGYGVLTSSDDLGNDKGDRYGIL